jgi:hypothetical protein
VLELRSPFSRRRRQNAVFTSRYQVWRER